MSELPKGWLRTDIGNVTTVVAGGTPKASDKSNFAEPGEGIAWLTPADLSKYNKKSIAHGSRDLSSQGLKSSSAKLMPKGTILFSSRAPIGYSVIAENEIATNQGFKNFVLPEGVDSSYAYYYLKSIKHIAESMGTGTTFKELSGTVAKTLPFVLAPTNEQVRIANKLDSILAKVDAAQARLDKIPNILKRFRQSVLAAATSGELSKEWRDENSVDMNSWSVSCLGKLAEVKTGNTPLKSNNAYYENGDIPWLTSTVTGHSVVNTAHNFVTKLAVEECRLKIFPPGTLLIAMYGEGKTRGQVTEIKLDATINQACAAIQINEDMVSKDFVKLCISDNYERTRMMAEGGAQPNLNLSKVRSIPVPLPSLNEQKEIFRRVESLFSMADIVEKKFNDAKAKIDRLTQSILAKAFRGELVPQDENDDPASVLLEKIKTELAKKTAKNAKKKATAKPKKPVSSSKESVKKEFIRNEPGKQVEIDFTDEQVKRKNWLGDNFIFVERALQNLKDTTFTTEQFQSITSFSKSYDELKALILTLVKGIPGLNEPLIEIADWDEKTGNYSFKIKD